MKKTAITLLGYGRMAKNHYRVLNENPEVRVVGVIDPKVEEKEGFSKEWREDWIAQSDAVIVASGTGTHYDIGIKILERGKPILMEKPLAHDLNHARELSRLAKQKDVFLGVGHLERFNPAVLKLKEILDAGWLGKPIHFSVTRVGGYPSSVDVSNNVLVDLSVHDFDVLNYLVGPMQVIAAVGSQAWADGIVDTAEILAKNSKGMSASLHVNWITPTKIRTLRVTGEKGVCFVDYILQSCTLFGGNLLKTNPSGEFDFHSLIHEYQNTDRVEFGVKKEEPLKIQLVEFLKAIRGKKSLLCSHEDAVFAVSAAQDALELALKQTTTQKKPHS